MTQNINRFESGVGTSDLTSATSVALSQFTQDLMQQNDNRGGKPPIDCDKYPLSKGCETPGGPGLENLHPGKPNDQEKDCDEARKGNEAKEAKDAKEGREGRDSKRNRQGVRVDQVLPQLEIVGN